jgi:regulator of RNase E activity RraA
MSELSDIIDALKPVSTATITTVLLKHGLRRIWMRGTRPIRSGQPRVVGRAFTLRFIPAREDLATPASWSSPRSTRAAIEEMPPGCIAVADAMGVTDAGIFGDILCARIKQRGVAGLVTDGVVRDMAGVLKTGLGLVPGCSFPSLSRRPHLRQLAGADRMRRRKCLSRRSCRR